VLDDASAKDTEQKQAVGKAIAKTNLVNGSMSKGHDLIRKVQNAAKGTYAEDDNAKMKEFHIGGKSRIDTEKAMLSELKYMKTVAIGNKSDLAANGVDNDDITAFDGIIAELTSNLADQKNAQKVQKAATAARNVSIKALQKSMNKIQKSAKAIFAKQPSVLTEFESIHDGRHGTRKDKSQPPAVEPTKSSK